MKIKDIVSIIFFSLFLNAPLALAQNAAILPQGKTQFLDQNANPLSSGTVDFYIPSTTTRKTTWQDAGKTIPNSNPVVLDAGGRAIIYGDGTYRQIVKAKNGNLIFDAVTASAGTGGSTTSTGDGDLVGTVKPWAGFVAPNQYVFTYGQEISRATYAAFFTAVTLNQNFNCTSASPILTGLSDTSQLPFGAVLETTCIPAGSTVIGKTTTTVTMSNNASLTTLTSGVFFPYGNGNGSTTFNVPDFRGVVLGGRTNMGGVTSSVLTSANCGNLFPNSIYQTCGNQTATLTGINLPAYTPTGTVSTTTGITDGRTWTVDGQPLGTGANPSVFQQAGAGLAILGPKTISVTGSISASSTSTFIGTAQGGTSTPFSIIQPTSMTNYIIKIVPDQNSASASGVTSLGLMTGDIACGSGLLCTGNIISSTDNFWAASGNNIYNTNSDNVNIITNLVAAKNGATAVNRPAFGVYPNGEVGSFISGNLSSPITADTSTVLISRFQAMTGTLNNAAALGVVIQGNDNGGGAQASAINSTAYQYGTGDALGVGGRADQYGSGFAYGAYGFVNVMPESSGASGVGLYADVANLKGNYGYSPTGVSYMNGLFLQYLSPGGFLGGGAIQVAAPYGNIGGRWDVGIGFMRGDYIKTASIQDDTNSTHLFYTPTGSHVNGIHLNAGATFSGNAYDSPNFAVNGATGGVTASGYTALGIANSGKFTATRANGTAASPTAIANGDVLAEFTSGGYANGAYTNPETVMASRATENWTSTARGRRTEFYTVALGTTTPVLQGIFNDNGQLILTQPLPVTGGGTGLASYAVGDLLYASTTSALSKLADVATGNAIISGGVGVAPSWGKIGISTHVNGLGTGIATALGTNVGTAGAPVILNGVLGSPSSVGTMPAFTLGGTVSGGGNQINNVIIGNSTPLAGSFTTLSASTSLTSPLHIGGSGTTGTQLTLKSTTGNGTTDAIEFVGGNNGAISFGKFDVNGFSVITKLSVTNNNAIGVANPIAQFNSSGASELGFSMNNTATGGHNWQMLATAGGSGLGQGNMYLYDATVGGIAGGRFKIDTAGQVSVTINTASTSKTTGSLINTGGFGNAGAIFTDTLSVITMANAATTSAVCYNTATGLFTYNSTIGTCTVSLLSAKNLKAPLSNKEGFDIVMAMEPWRYEMKKDLPTYTKGEQIGFVAEYTKDSRIVAHNEDGTLGGIRYEQYTAALTAAFKYLKADNDNLKKEIKELKRKFN